MERTRGEGEGGEGGGGGESGKRSGENDARRGGDPPSVRGFRSRNPRWKLTLKMPRTALGFQEGRARVVATPHREDSCRP